MFITGEMVMRTISMLFLVGVAALSVPSGAKAQGTAAPPEGQARHGNSMQGAADWRERMQTNHNSDSSAVQQVRRLTSALELTPAQQGRVLELSKEHNARIQKILDTAPPTLTYQDFQTQVHEISRQYHDSVNAMLTPHQLELMKAMVGHMGGGGESRHTP
jgi:hypothetical protein